MAGARYGSLESLRVRGRLCATLVTVAWMAIAVPLAHAEPHVPGWRSDSRLYLSGISNFQRTDASSSYFNTVAITAELKFSRPARPYYGGLFVDYRNPISAGAKSSTNAGAYFRYDFGLWDATNWLFASKPVGLAESWIYAGRLRYRAAENHKIGSEATSRLARLDSPLIAIGYYTSFNDSLSLNMAADPGLSRGSDLAARIELVWQLQ